MRRHLEVDHPSKISLLWPSTVVSCRCHGSVVIASGRMAVVTRVDPEDDSIRRWVVWHYRYDPDRHERRNVVVAAFDNSDEFHAEIKERAAQLRARRECGERVHPSERISGTEYQPGHRRLQRNAHLLKRAFQHGVVPAQIAELDLPPNVHVVRFERRW